MDRNISFATFNLYNLQQPNRPWRRNATPYTPEAYQRKVEWSARALSALDADVIAFQELWSKPALEAVFDRAGLRDRYALAFIKDQWYDIAVAAAVRAPWRIEQTLRHKEFPDAFRLVKRGDTPGDDRLDDEIEVDIHRFSRTVLQLSLVHADRPEIPAIQVFLPHLKSKLPTWLDPAQRDDPALKPHRTALGSALSTIRRTAEAAALRFLLTEVMKHSHIPVAVLGDLNDGQLSNTLAILTQQPSYRLYDASRAGYRSDAGLYTAATLQQFRSHKDVYYSHIHKGIREILDHVLVSEQFYDHSINRIWTFRDLRIWTDHLDDADTDATDHGLVRARFVYDPAK